MAKSTIKSLAATTAITLATVGTPAFAEEVTPTVEATNDAVVSNGKHLKRKQLRLLLMLN